MADRATITVGTAVILEDRRWVIDAFIEGGVTIRAGQDRRTLPVSALLAAPNVRLGSRAPQPRLADATVLASASPDARSRAEQLEPYLLAVIHGIDGPPEAPFTKQTASLFCPHTTTRTERIAAAAELIGDTSTRTVSRWLSRYENAGVAGLVDRRASAAKPRRPSVDPRFREELGRILAENVAQSRLSNTTLRRRTEIAVEDRFGFDGDGNPVVAFPSRATFDRLLRDMTEGTGYRGPRSNYRSAQSVPRLAPRRRRISRPGQIVLLDTNRLDVHAIEETTGEWISVAMTVAIDAFSCSLLAMRLTPVGERGVDTALLLHDMLTVRPPIAGLDERRWAYHGVPEQLIVGLAGIDPLDGVPHLPLVRPQQVIVDRGAPYVSRTFKDACLRLGISVEYARPHTPTDKARVERFFGTFNTTFLQMLPGYTGSNVHGRGHRVEGSAFFFLHELERMIRRWWIEWYQEKPNPGLAFPDMPGRTYSPNEMYEMGIAISGFLWAPADKDAVLGLLPQKQLTVTRSGIKWGLTYNSSDLDELRTEMARAERTRKVTVHRDPRDTTVVHLQHPDTHEWLTIPWIMKDDDTDVYVNDVVLAAAKAQLARQGFRRPDDELLDAELRRQQRDIAAASKQRSKSRRNAARAAVHHQSANNDRPQRTDTRPAQRAPQPPAEGATDAPFDPDEITPLPGWDDDHPQPSGHKERP